MIMKLVNYRHGISNRLRTVLHEVLGYALAIILMIFFCTVKIFPLFEQLTHNVFHIL